MKNPMREVKSAVRAHKPCTAVRTEAKFGGFRMSDIKQ